ncbi:DcaP family trimeric outer membrane transporter [Gilvimarinus sp. DA14]|uniref:DcaP family trimeric outer membrane transporter n=1 Tax=Gilvimarinus sp. DA14 TaxID=2956798 RepID=UPI0020B86B48|nr:DcaP family trimeric outer membrane transporter [Gilvimarinus sp. DA14]UTF59739.1 DcaP family trimeric outer membrane transporter [Gilvimarinus sp. DA14]
MRSALRFLLPVLVLTPAAFTFADELDDLRDEVLMTRAELEMLQARLGLDEAIVSSNDSWRQKFEIYGFAQLDYIQDFERVQPEWDSTLRPSRIPTLAGQYGSDGQAILSARQSRLGVKADFPAGDDSIYTVFEFDMFGVGSDEGQTTIRLRHAYGQWRSLLAGQTNTLFMDGDLFPNVIDYWGPAGMVYLRNPQIRWTPLEGRNSFALAIENPGNDVDDGLLGAAGFDLSGSEALPDLTAQYRLQDQWGHLQVAGILRELSYEEQNTSNHEPDGSDLGYGINISSVLNFGDDHLRAGVVYGEGIASYMNDGGMDMAPDNLDPTDLAAVPLLGVVAYYEHAWNDRMSSAVGYSFTEVDNQSLQLDSAFNKGEYASVNVLYSPLEQVLLGAEYLWGKRTDFGGASGTDNRVQFSVKYTFSSKDFF